MSVIVHRDIPGEHIEEGNECWCRPVVVEEDDFRTSDEIVEAAKAPEA